MGRPPKRLRAGEGKHTVIHAKRNGKVYDYWQFSFLVPLWAIEKWPGVKWRKDRRIVKPFPMDRKLDGEAWLNANLRALHAGTWVPPQIAKAKAKQQSITFREYAKTWVEDRHKPDGSPLKETAKQKYRESLDLYLYDYFGDMPMSSVTPKDVQQWWDTFKPTRMDADLENRRAHVYAHLKAIFRSAATEPMDAEGNTLIPSSPCRIRAAKPKAKHVPVRPTNEQMDALVQAMPDYLRLVVRICDATGMREGEALGLCVKNIDFDNLKIRVRQQVQRPPDANDPKRYQTKITTLKTASSRDDIIITAALADEIRAWINARGIAGDPEAMLFNGKRTRLVAPQTYRNAFAKARQKVPGLETLRAHDLRKDALSGMSDNGATIPEIMHQGRHTTMAVASKYQVTSEDHMRKVMERMDAARGHTTASTPQDTTKLNDDATAALADSLAGMNARERVEALRPLDMAERLKVLGTLPKEAMAETLAVMLPDGNGGEAHHADGE